MAKQRGIHQISGKINNLCYYEQKYVRGGLIRRINDAMSERLKTDPVFANTRRANKIFGGCSMYASILLDFFGSRNTYLFKPYRHALLTSAVKKFLLDQGSGEEYPIILIRSLAFSNLPRMIESIVKNSIFNSFRELENYIYNLSLDDTRDITFNQDSLENYCKKYNCIGVQLSVTNAKYIYSSNYDPSSESYTMPDCNPGGRVSYVNWFLGEDNDAAVLSTDTGSFDDTASFWIVYALPIIRRINGRVVTGETGASCGLITFYAS